MTTLLIGGQLVVISVAPRPGASFLAVEWLGHSTSACLQRQPLPRLRLWVTEILKFSFKIWTRIGDKGLKKNFLTKF